MVVEEDPKRIHIALYAESEEALKAYHEAAIAAGGTDNGAPGPRTYYPANLRACFVIDLDDNNIECGILSIGTECGRIEIWAIPIFSPVLNDNGIEYPSPKLLHTLPANDTHFDTVNKIAWHPGMTQLKLLIQYLPAVDETAVSGFTSLKWQKLLPN